MTAIHGANHHIQSLQQFLHPKKASLEKHALFANQHHQAQKNMSTNKDPLVTSSVAERNVSKFASFYFEKATSHSAAVVDPELSAKDYSKAFHKETITQIMKMPIEVEVERDEMQQALLFNSLGIDFLEYKELGVRREMLSLAKNGIENDVSLAQFEKSKFIDAIRHFDARLEQAQNALLGGAPTDALDSDMSDPQSPWAILVNAAA
ncbi:hypothetical protein PCIT_b0185 [Pseudoalteromonas citrea]|uniref:Uncharacterized protein n=2 Tax=Pseudoalteromonas citrea TaxID=43655 RepID=A0AAD4AE21_9GAMM|nr:hypothetical protein [Pseudoalteromonas citrea]KAF7764240.1 hypothetical protein PCIT_b0185 [Pseudoalteromonas citrea]